VVENNKVLISACLLGKRVRYDGKTLEISAKIIQQWLQADRVVTICPEADVGMGIPRPPAEITGGDGFDVLSGCASVVTEAGLDVTDKFLLGAKLALSICQQHDISVAVLSESSPSCGSTTIYDGHFRRHKITGKGVTVALLEQNGIQVFNQFELEKATFALIL